MRRALLSVTDKSGVVPFAKGLRSLGFELVSTGGTAKALRDAGLAVTDVSEVTGFPEMLDGRVKTLHPMVHGGLLGDPTNPAHLKAMSDVGIAPIELLCVNLYQFEKTVTGVHTTEEAIESIDIGGPAMIRAAAKNGANVTVVVDSADYNRVLTALADGEISTLRKELQAKAFRHTAYYDSMIAGYLSEEPMTETLSIGLRKTMELRYGENPHQSAALYALPLAGKGIGPETQLWGKELSYNNLLDADAARDLVLDLPKGSCAIIKHGNPCGASFGATLGESYREARSSDPISAFGGIAAFNGFIDIEAAEAMTEKGNFLEVIIGDGFSDEAVELFKARPGWGQNVRLLSVPSAAKSTPLTYRSIRGGVVVQDADDILTSDWRVVTKIQPTEEQSAALRFAWSVVRHVKSNAIVLCTSRQLKGVGAGQMNRVQSVRLAIEQAGSAASDCALASDAFFPFPDSIETLAKEGVRAVVEPGGSKKDDEVIAAADRLGVAMVFTGQRHFRH